MCLSKRISLISPSITLQIAALAKQFKSEGKDVIDFGAGEPDFDTPDFIKEAAIKAIQEGFTKYTPSEGILPLREAICRKFLNENKLTYSPDQVIVSSGAKHSIFNVVMALVDNKDEVIIPSPYWVSYPEMVKLANGKIKFLKTKANNKFKIEIDSLKKAITKRTKLFILNSPSNPTGCVYNREELEKIALICAENKIFVISDEIYEKIIYDQKEHYSIGSFNNEIYELTITVNGLSKAFSMTGWRIGYIGASKKIIPYIKRLQDHSTSNASSISQKAALAALTIQNDFVKNIRATFQTRRDYIVDRMSKMKKIIPVIPDGAFYIFCKISKTGLNSMDFSQRLLKDALVAVVPGIGFGEDNYIRISFAKDIKEIQKGLDRIEGWLKTLK